MKISQAPESARNGRSDIFILAFKEVRVLLPPYLFRYFFNSTRVPGDNALDGIWQGPLSQRKIPALREKRACLLYF
jgi:hypothetical protein